jgi:hypothetical protein
MLIGMVQDCYSSVHVWIGYCEGHCDNMIDKGVSIRGADWSWEMCVFVFCMHVKTHKRSHVSRL